MTLANSGYSFRHVLGPSAAKHTTLTYLVEHFCHSTREQWQERLRAKEIQVDESIANGDERLRPGRLLIWNRPAWAEPEVSANYQVLYRDDCLLAVHKPSGLPTLPGAGFYQNTLLSLVQVEFPKAIPLHRLGRATSGVVLFALEKETCSLMAQRWNTVEKDYLALAAGDPLFEWICIRTPIGMVDHPRLGKVYAATHGGKESRSIATVLERRLARSLVAVRILTGRPHQIRIHLASIGHPLVGDPMYAPGGGLLPTHPGLPGDPGYWLHAHRLRFLHPSCREWIEIEAPSPVVLQRVVLQQESPASKWIGD